MTAFVSPAAIPALRDAEVVMREIERRPGVVYAALVPNVRGPSGPSSRVPTSSIW